MISDGLKELKVFVDLALISAGEQPLDIDRVQGLKAFDIYLIYDFRWTEGTEGVCRPGPDISW